MQQTTQTYYTRVMSILSVDREDNFFEHIYIWIELKKKNI